MDCDKSHSQIKKSHQEIAVNRSPIPKRTLDFGNYRHILICLLFLFDKNNIERDIFFTIKRYCFRTKSPFDIKCNSSYTVSKSVTNIRMHCTLHFRLHELEKMYDSYNTARLTILTRIQYSFLL